MRIQGFPYEYFDEFIKEFIIGKKDYIDTNNDIDTNAFSKAHNLFVSYLSEIKGKYADRKKQQDWNTLSKNQKDKETDRIKTDCDDRFKTTMSLPENSDALIVLKHAVWLWTYPVDMEYQSAITQYAIDSSIKTDISTGTAGIGQARSSKPSHIKFLLEWFLEAQKNGADVYSVKKNYIQKYANYTQGNLLRNFSRNILLHICSPEQFEPIGLQDDKEAICSFFEDIYDLSQIAGFDEKLMFIRKQLILIDEQFENMNFYRWQPRQKPFVNYWKKNEETVDATEIEKLKQSIKLKNISAMITNRIKEIEDFLLKTKNIIFTGAPGTGKTYLAKEIAKSLAGDNYEMVQFHPSYDYSDFVEGLRPVKSDGETSIGFERKDGVFKAFCKNALEDGYEKTEKGWKYKGKNAAKYVFIIDEINRGEMSKIFGELFFSIDPGYRGTEGKIKTQYANLNDTANKFDEVLGNNERKEDFGHFFVPENVYIIGTMNDIDRSVESMDFAMRRRFAFKEVTALSRTDMWNGNIEETQKEFAKYRMINMNKAIEAVPGLNSAYHIGPSYFLKLKDYDNDYKQLWDNHIAGVVAEYLRGMSDAEKYMKEIQAGFDNDKQQ